MFRRFKTKCSKLQQRISALESQNEELVRHIKTMEQAHREERTKCVISLMWRSCFR